jgi:predicted nucleotidyltransferase
MFERPDILEGDSRLAELVRRLVDAFQRERLYLFGSRARAQADADSDYDLLMILPKLEGPAYRVAQQAHSLVWGLGISADILVWSRDEFERRVEVKTSLPAVVLREGTLLHEA